MKTCTKCKETKTIENFEKHKTASDGRRGQCHSCRYSVRIKNNPNRLEKQKQWSLMYRRGISIEDYNKIFKEQNKVCKICGKKNKTGKRFSVDHDHKTGYVRGILCNSCNTMIGFAQDDINILQSAINYLKRGG